MTTDSGSPIVRLFNTLLVTFGAIFLGFLCMRFKIILPDQGHMKAMGFFVGQIAFPMLFFKTVATTELGKVDMGVVAACTLAKVFVMASTWGLAFVSYEKQRPRGQRVLTATVFGYFAIASNDFAIGFPVIKALYDETIDMRAYIAANALATAILFNPTTIILFAVGGALLQDGTQERKENSGKQCGLCKSILSELARNPVIISTLCGLIFKEALGFTLIQGEDGVSLPSPLSDAVDLVTSPFTMCALFLTGASLRSASIQVWPCTLALMKVVVCAYAAFFFGTRLVSSADSPDIHDALQDFTFFYGAIPTSSAPIVFASQFDPGAVGLVATACLFGLVLAGPIMFTTALFLQDSGDMDHTLAQVQLGIDAVSLASGAVLMFLIILLRHDWGFRCPVKQFLAWYGFTATAYAIVSLIINPSVNSAYCDRFNQADFVTPVVFIFGWLQNACSLMLLLFVFFKFVPKKFPNRLLLGLFMACTCWVMALVPTFVATPNTINEVCQRQDVGGLHLWANVTWSCLKLLAIGVITSYGLASSRAQERSDDADAVSGDAPSQNVSWTCQVPHGVLLAITTLFAVKTMTQVVNSLSILVQDGSQQDKGSFAAMLVLETFFAHGQVLFLLIALAACDEFSAVTSASTAWLAGLVHEHSSSY